MTVLLRRLLAAGLAISLVACGTGDPAALVASAKTYLAQANPQTAIIQLKSALQKSPDNAEGRALLARALLDIGDPVGAETEIRKAIALRWSDDEAYPLLARAMNAQGKFRAVISELEGRNLGTAEARADLFGSLATARMNTGDVAGARTAIAAAAREVPDDPRVLVVQAELAGRENDLAQAGRFLDQALAKQPKNVDAILLKSALLGMQNQPDAAIQLLQDGIAANPTVATLYFALVSHQVRAGNVEATGRTVAKLREIAPTDARTLYADALWSFTSGDNARAADILQRIMGALPDHLPAQMLNAMVQYQLGSFGLAEDSLRKVLARQPGEPAARRLLAATYVRTGRASLASDLLTPLLQAGTTDPFVWRTAGEAALATGDVTAAAKYYEQAASLDAKNVPTKVRLAQVRLAGGEADRAFRDLEALSSADAEHTEADLALVAAYLRQRRFDQALQAAQNVVKKHPEMAGSHQVLGTVQLVKRDLPAARTSFEQALARDPKYVQAARSLAMIDVQDGKVDAARARYDAMLAKDPSNESLLLASAELASLSEEGADSARKFVERAIVAHPTSVQPRLMLIALAAREGNQKAALAAAQAAAVALPGDAQLQEALGSAQLASGDANQAIETFQRLTKQQPQNASALVRLAEAQASSKDVAGAITSVRKAVALKPDQADFVPLLSKLLLANNQADDAIAEARRVQKARPREAVGYVLEGEIRAAQNRWADATAAYRQALSRQASPTVAGRVYVAMSRDGKAAEAAAFASQWNRDNPKDITLHVLAAQAAQGRKDTAQAIAEYRAALAIEPDSWVVLNNLAWLLSSTDQPAALELAERAYHLAPLNPGVLDTLGWILADGRDAARGVQMLRMAANLAPRVPEIRLHYGMALAKAGDKASARRQFETLTRLPANSTFRADAEKALESL